MSDFAQKLTLARAPQRIAALVTKFGGSPVGFPQDRWPVCSLGTPLTFLAQIRLDAPMAFSDRYAMAYVFMCQTYDEETSAATHETFDPEGDHTAVILVERPSSNVTRSPVGTLVEFEISFEQLTEPAVSWAETYSLTADLEDLEYENEEDYPDETHRLGGRVGWIQGPERPVDGRGRPMRFLCQFDACEIAEEDPNIELYAGDGIIYVFFSEEGYGRVVWQSS